MRKIAITALSTLLLVLLLVGCSGSLPNGMDVQRLETDAKEVLNAVNARDWRGLNELFPTSGTTEDGWAAMLDPVLDSFGEFETYTGVSYTQGEEPIEDEEPRTLAYVLLECRYAEQTVVWRVVFTTEYEVIGLWV